MVAASTAERECKGEIPRSKPPIARRRMGVQRRRCDHATLLVRRMLTLFELRFLRKLRSLDAIPHWRVQHFAVGDDVHVQPIGLASYPEAVPWWGTIVSAKKNRFGRVSYSVRPRGMREARQVELEELAWGRRCQP